MIKKAKKILMLIGLIAIVGGLIYLQHYCPKSPAPLMENEYKAPEETYRTPVIPIPFLTKKQPIKDENLPIPKKDIKASVHITLPDSETKDIKLIIDKKGHVYRSKDIPKNVKIEVTKWKPKFIDFDFKLGASFLFDLENINYCLSLDYIRIYKFYLGSDIGISVDDYTMDLSLIGLSGRYNFFAEDAEFKLLGTIGYNLLNKNPYIGFSIRW